MTQYDLKQIRQRLRKWGRMAYLFRSRIGKPIPWWVWLEIAESPDISLPIEMPRHPADWIRQSLAVYLRSQLPDEPGVIETGRLTRRQRLGPANIELVLGFLNSEMSFVARFAASVFDQLFFTYPERAGKMAFFESLVLCDGWLSPYDPSHEPSSDVLRYDRWEKVVWNGKEASATIVLRRGDNSCCLRMEFYDELVRVLTEELGVADPVVLEYECAAMVKDLESILADQGWPITFTGPDRTHS